MPGQAMHFVFLVANYGGIHAVCAARLLLALEKMHSQTLLAFVCQCTSLSVHKCLCSRWMAMMPPQCSRSSAAPSDNACALPCNLSFPNEDDSQSTQELLFGNLSINDDEKTLSMFQLQHCIQRASCLESGCGCACDSTCVT